MEVHFSWALLSGPSGPLSVCGAAAERSASAFTSTIMCLKRALRVWSAHLQQDSQPLGAMSPYSISPTIELSQCCPGPLVKMSLIMMGKRTMRYFPVFSDFCCRLNTSENCSPWKRKTQREFHPFYPFIFIIFGFCPSTCVTFLFFAALLSIVFWNL